MRTITIPGLACLLLLCGLDSALAQDQNTRAADEQALKDASIDTNDDTLLAFLKKRTLTPAEHKHFEEVIVKLGSSSFRERDQAASELFHRGPVIIDMLKRATRSSDLEISRRAERTIERIKETDYPINVPAAVVRLIAERKPVGASQVLLDFLPFADNDLVADEVRGAFARLAVRDKKVDPVLLEALGDKVAIRRAAAGEALVRARAADQRERVAKLLHDPEPLVRLRIAMALAYAEERDAIPVLIDLLPQVTLVQAWQAEAVLYRLAQENSPPAVSLGHDPATRQKCRAAWMDWWKQHGARVDLAELNKTPRLLGYTVVVLLDLGRVAELDRNDQLLWQIEGLNLPLDVQVLPNKQVLVAEYHGSRVTQRNLSGEVVWEYQIAGPLVAQRLSNGNTFIVTDAQLLEVDVDRKLVLNLPAPGDGERIMKAVKLPNGEIACLTTEARVVRLDSTGKVLHSFPVSLGSRLFGGRIDMMPNGRVLVPHHGENKVVEYDANGKVMWEVKVDQPIAAVRLPNGNTLVTSMREQEGAIEFDRDGDRVWQYRDNTRVTRALKR